MQVSWTEAGVSHRAVGGTLVYTGTTVKISGLIDVSSYNVGLTGQLEIGPAGGDVAVISVSVGNLNPARDTIIDFSDKTNGAPGTSIKLPQLIEWIKEKNKETGSPTAMPEIPDNADGSPKPKLEDFTIEFKKFYINITQKTFDFWVASGKDKKFTFGDFTITNVGFRVTNVPIPPPVPLPEPKDAGKGKD